MKDGVEPGSSDLARLAAILEAAAAQIRELVGSSTSSLAVLPAAEQPSLAMARPPETRALLTAEEFADTLRVNTRTLRDMVRRGDVPQPIRLGKCLRWRRADIERWIQEQPPS